MVKLKTDEFYCVQCRKVVKVPPSKIKVVKLKNGNHALRATYQGKKLVRFISNADESKMVKRYGRGRNS